MKRSMRTRYTFYRKDNGDFVGWGDCPFWAQKVRDAWGDKATETQERVMFITDRAQGAVNSVNVKATRRAAREASSIAKVLSGLNAGDLPEGD